MIKKIGEKLKDFWKTEGQEGLKTPTDQHSVFVLQYDKLPVGELVLENGEWAFRYTQQFKNQHTIKPLPDFQDVNKVYKSSELFPFFIQRIPGLSQPEIKETIQRERIDRTDEVALLKRFGEFSIANPFRLRLTL